VSAKGTGDGLRIAGYAAYFKPMPSPRFLSARGMAMAMSAQVALAGDDPDAERQARGAIEVLVDAFLADRRSNRACFTLAHRLGRTVNRLYGCRLTYDADSQTYSNTCGVLALHGRIALSPGGPAFSVCSNCGAEDFECDHIPGRVYEGRLCFRTITEWPIEEISLVRIPRDPRCYRVHTPITMQEAERLRRGPLGPDEHPICEHCRDCRAIHGPTEEDLDPASWPRLPDEE
jgi:hypothetical protein